ncbi:hypothetical protein Ccrd_002468 [Cynara cardunculus var. scolymus]|uniref:Uncharacterized protein n=1 Tax=Cynara cardunculus var. scolymus TaxID=59895 RepID=A0A103XRC4_CYNCS|nr:hypothetical protein Ccrd_002468 [Cynara cardunculus var. scolymus]
MAMEVKKPRAFHSESTNFKIFQSSLAEGKRIAENYFTSIQSSWGDSRRSLQPKRMSKRKDKFTTFHDSISERHSTVTLNMPSSVQADFKIASGYKKLLKLNNRQLQTSHPVCCVCQWEKNNRTVTLNEQGLELANYVAISKYLLVRKRHALTSRDKCNSQLHVLFGDDGKGRAFQNTQSSASVVASEFRQNVMIMRNLVLIRNLFAFFELRFGEELDASIDDTMRYNKRDDDDPYIKPAYFHMGLEQRANQVYISDSGLAKKYKDINTTHQQIPYG